MRHFCAVSLHYQTSPPHPSLHTAPALLPIEGEMPKRQRGSPRSPLTVPRSSLINPLQRYEKHLTYTSMQRTKISLWIANIFTTKRTKRNSSSTCPEMACALFRENRWVGASPSHPPPIQNHQPEPRKTRILSHTDPTEVTDFHWLIRDSYAH